ncbi:glutamyl-tRNA reductase [Flavihumibacter sp. CACIAM 22H1]|uniref:glutamyl-tRNA reductase n=1 Tax=Flavihumibacter sp. CACIAM 22H1 TaxID=1812911 RepID=UPI000ABAD13C|nr:glutamyl-tRNA reductase [Flavihumibacter sp. CACIAM 22H1]
MGDYPKDLQHFFVVGLSYKKSDSAVRSRFAISQDQYDLILEHATTKGVAELFVLSTCNRTELYAIAPDADTLVNLICEATGQSATEFNHFAYQYRAETAVQHLFQVAAGLDSQILGDYEIVGQIKLAVKHSKAKAAIGPFIERLYNQVLQTSKLVKNYTALSSGSVSVSFAAIQYLKERVPQVANKSVLLIGTGKIGRNTCKNLIDYLGCSDITLMNRSFEKAAKLAQELQLAVLPAQELQNAVVAADIIIVASNAPEAIIYPQHLKAAKKQWIIDLSIPNNVDPSVAQVKNKELLNVDQLSLMKDETLQKRQAEVPKALAIIAAQTAEFYDWCRMRKQLAVLGQVKLKLEEIHVNTLSADPQHTQWVYHTTFATTDEAASRIQKVLNTMAAKMRVKNQRGCHYLEAINDFMAFGAN